MVTLYTIRGCSRCEMTKRALEDRNIAFEAVVLNSLTPEEQQRLLDNAEQAGIASFPIIQTDDGTLTKNINDLEEV